MIACAGCSGAPGGLPDSAKSATSYPTNAAGETYGSALVAGSPDDQPDLILIVATDGQTGYARRTELEGPTPANPSEAVKLQYEQDLAILTVVYEVLEGELDISLDASDADLEQSLPILATVTNVLASKTPDTACRNLLSDLIAASKNAPPDPAALLSTATSKTCAQVRDAAADAHRRIIPVYQSDGQTIIGEFVTE